MKILTWNVNGIRAVSGKSSVKKMLDSLESHIVCLQETKVTRDMLDEPTAIVDGYQSFFSFSRKRTGYSGTANYCKASCSPTMAEEGLAGRLSSQLDGIVGCYGDTDSYSDDVLDALDAEGRCVITQHKIQLPVGQVTEMAIINVYVPRAGDREDRLEYKLRFLSMLQSRAEALLDNGVHVIVLGDLNLTHRALDNCDPESDADFQRRSSRIWINNMLRHSERDPKLKSYHPSLSEVSLSGLNGGKFSDAYRSLHPDQECSFTNWDTSTDARKSNYGRRLDYILVSEELTKYVTDCQILSSVEGSDHCPVVVTLNCDPLPSSVCPQMCSKFMPEFRGQQQKLSSFFSKSVQKEQKTDVEARMNGENDSDVPSSQEMSLSQNQEKTINSSQISSLKKSTSSQNAASSVINNSKPKLKRDTSSPEKGKNKKSRFKQEDSLTSKQSSLMSFFSRANSSQKKPQELTRILGHNERDCKAHQNAQQTQSSPVILSLDSDDDSKSSQTLTNSQESFNSYVDGASNGAPNVSQQTKLSRNNDIVPNREDSILNHISSLDNPLDQDKYLLQKGESVGTTPQKDKTLASQKSSQAWKSLLKGPAPPPLCPGHKEPCVLKTVRKNGPNKNKQFYSCPRPDGPPGNKECRCNFFQWLGRQSKKKP